MKKIGKAFRLLKSDKIIPLILSGVFLFTGAAYPSNLRLEMGGYEARAKVIEKKIKRANVKGPVTLAGLSPAEILEAIEDPGSSSDPMTDKFFKKPFELYNGLLRKIEGYDEGDPSAATVSADAQIAKANAFMFLLHGERKYAEKAIELLDRSIKTRPSLNPMDWARDAELLTVWCQVYDLLMHSPELSGELADIKDKLGGFTAGFYKCALIIGCGPARWLRIGQNNYRLKMAGALGLAGVVLDAERLKQHAKRSIDYVLDFQTTKGGAYAEGPFYATYSLKNILPFLAAEGAVDERVKNILYWLMKISGPEGIRPNFDDNHEAGSLSGLAAYLLNDGSLLYDGLLQGTYVGNGNIDLSVDAIVSFVRARTEDLVPDKPKWRPEELFMPDEGVALISEPEKGIYLFVTAENGKTRKASGSHEHCDEGSFILYYFNGDKWVKLVMDSGYGNFWGSIENEMYKADKHSGTPRVNGKGSYEVWKVFRKLRLEKIGGIMQSALKGRGADAVLEDFIDHGDMGYSFRVKTKYRGVEFKRMFYVNLENMVFIRDEMVSKTSHKYTRSIQGALGEPKPIGGEKDTWLYKNEDTVLKVITMAGDVEITKERVLHADKWQDEDGKYQEHWRQDATTEDNEIITVLLYGRSEEELPFVSADILKGMGYGSPGQVLKKMNQLLGVKTMQRGKPSTIGIPVINSTGI